MRVVFINLHKNMWYTWTLRRIIARNPPMMKRRFILDYLLKNNIEVINLITPDGCGLPSNIRYHIHNYTLIKKEASYVFKKSHIPIEKVKTINDSSLIKADDIVIYYATFYPEQFKTSADTCGIKIVDHIHFVGDKKTADLVMNSNMQYYLSDVDLLKYSKLYQKNYMNSKAQFIMLPFTYQERFCIKKPFKERKAKAVAMGTLTMRNTPDYIDAFGTPFLQPHRKMIMDNASKYPNEIDSFISEYLENKLLDINESDIAPFRIYKRIYNYFSTGRQKSYFSFNMVDKYNEYKMFICPEDVNGSYGIGVIEGMACGCAMIGLNYGAFEDLGMQAGIHYISYDGTIEDLIEKIRFFQRPENQDELEMIARSGCEYVRSNFSEEAVAKKFITTISQLSNNIIS